MPNAISTPKTMTMLITAISQGFVVTGPTLSPLSQKLKGEYSSVSIYLSYFNKYKVNFFYILLPMSHFRYRFTYIIYVISLQ